MMWKKYLGLILVTAVWAGCSNSPEISASDYDQSCSTGDDCVRVWEGSVCGCGRAAAINESALDQFKADESRLQRRCSSITQCVRGGPLPRAVCKKGQCQTELVDATSRPDGGGETDDARGMLDGGGR